MFSFHIIGFVFYIAKIIMTTKKDSNLHGHVHTLSHMLSICVWWGDPPANRLYWLLGKGRFVERQQ